MNREIGERWVRALRSGEYPQTSANLRSGDGYCCLGVLCEIAVADGVILSQYDQTVRRWGYGSTHETAILPDRVRRWAGLDHNNPGFVNEDGVAFNLAELNDGYSIDGTVFPPKSFAEIADVIERHFINT